jgi:hypothetical protein
MLINGASFYALTAFNAALNVALGRMTALHFSESAT